MTPEQKQKVCAALRSDKYKQGSGKLRYEHKGDIYWCCLGVIADTLLPVDWEEKFDGMLMGNHGVIPSRRFPAVKEEIFDSPDDQERLYGLNDFKRYSFFDIADYIEENM